MSSMKIRSIVEEDPVPDFLRYRLGPATVGASSPGAVPFWLLVTVWGMFAGVCGGLLALDAVLAGCPLWLIDSAARTVACVG